MHRPPGTATAANGRRILAARASRLAAKQCQSAYLAMLLAGAGLFGVLLFVNYYMQQNLGYSAVVTGLAFLPMVAMLMIFTNVSNVVLMPRTGPRPVVPAGMLLGAASAALLTRLGPHSTYVTGTAGVPPHDTGVTSATVNTGNQLGGSIGTSLLNTVFAGAIASYIAAHALYGRPSPHLLALAAIHGYTTAFWWTTGIFAVGAIICGALLRSGPLTSPAQQAAQDRPGAGAQEWPSATSQDQPTAPSPAGPQSAERSN